MVNGGQGMISSPLNPSSEEMTNTTILSSRPIVPGATAVSTFSDKRWDLTPAIFEAHKTAVSINWELTPSDFRPSLKRYIFHLLDHNPSNDELLRYGPRPSIQTVAHTVKFLNMFTRMLARRGHRGLSTLTEADFDAFLDEILARAATRSDNRHALAAVRTWWLRAELLPEDLRLPSAVPWDGRVPSELLSYENRNPSNSTVRISDLTINGLLLWSLRVVEDWAPDIVRLLAERERLTNELNPTTAGRISSSSASENVSIVPVNRVVPAQTRADSDAVVERVLAFLEKNRLRLPGKHVGGEIRLDGMHLARLLGWRSRVNERLLGKLAASGYPIADFDETLPADTLALDENGDPWLTIGYRESRHFRRVVRGACLVLISYLTGMRAGEVLNLRRGCVTVEGELTVVWGKTFKAVRDSRGEKVPQGAGRATPWVTVEPVANAVRLLEQIDDSELLFPRVTQDAGAERSVSAMMAASEMKDFVDWVNGYCLQRGRRDMIPPDPTRLNLSRFRRTLAWHIVREPRGLVAGALQYGHVHVQMMQGYAGTLDDGFVDDVAFERYLSRLEDLTRESTLLAEGAHVSGPAASEFLARVDAAKAHFAGKLARNGREAAVILSNRILQVHQGEGMHCVFNREQSLCVKSTSPVEQDLPELERCRSSCQCIARTDGDIVKLAPTIRRLEKLVEDTLAPPIRHQRDRETLQRLNRIVAGHVENISNRKGS